MSFFNPDDLRAAQELSSRLHQTAGSYVMEGGNATASRAELEAAQQAEAEHMTEKLAGQFFLFKTPERRGQRVLFDRVFASGGVKVYVLKDGTQIAEFDMSGIGEFLDGPGGPSGYAAGTTSQNGATVNELILPEDQLDDLGYPVPGRAPRKPKEPDDPVSILLQRAKIDLSDISLTLRLKVPPPQLVDMIRQFYEESDEKIVDFVVRSLDNDALVAAVREAIEDLIGYVRPVVPERIPVPPFDETDDEPTVEEGE